MKLRKVESYEVQYTWWDRFGDPQEEFDVDIAESELEDVVMDIVEAVEALGGTIYLKDIHFTKKISFAPAE